MQHHGCEECAIVSGKLVPRGEAPVVRDVFVIHPRPDDGAVPGWIIVAPQRHVEQIDQLSPRELTALGPLLGEVAAALRAETGAEKVYVSIFAEILAHLHVHVIARTGDIPADQRGPRVFLTTAPADTGKSTETGRRVLARLRTP